MASKITIIGAGSVGATIAYTLSQKDFVSDIVIIDINKDKADGEAMDIAQGTLFRNPVDVISGDYPDAKDSDIVIITSGVPRKPGQTRIELAQINVNIIKDIAPKIVAQAPKAKYIIVSNPVDVMTYAFIKASGVDESQVIGSGTLLDTMRLTYGISEKLKVSQKNIHAYVFGEHGDSSFVTWSTATIAGVPLDEYVAYSKNIGKEAEAIDKDALVEYVHKSGGEIIKRKGATFYGVSLSVVQLCEMLLSSYESVVTVSTMMHGEYGVEDVCTSCLAVIGPDGVKGRIVLPLSEEEVAKFQKSADALKAVIAQVQL